MKRLNIFSKRKKPPKHKNGCQFQNRKITIFDNGFALKVGEYNVNYCFYCGAKLR